MEWSGEEIYKRWGYVYEKGDLMPWKDEILPTTGLTEGEARGRFRRYVQGMSEEENFDAPEPHDPKVVINGNSGEVTAVYANPEDLVVVNPEQLLKIAGVDLTIWKLCDTGVQLRSWGQHSNLHGYKTLYYVRAPIERIVPEPINCPAVVPVTTGVVPIQARKYTGNLRKAIILPDFHVGFSRGIHTGKYTPYHDRDAVSIALQFAAKENPDEIYIIGDYLDLPEMSTRFTPQVEHRYTMQATLIEGRQILHQLRLACPSSRIFLLGGNHGDRRIADMIKTQNDWAYELRLPNDLNGHAIFSLPHWLQLDDLSVEWVGGYPDAYKYLNAHVGVKHGDKVVSKSGGTAKTMVENGLESWVFGHIHRVELAVRTIFFGGKRHEIVAASVGCLCKTGDDTPGSIGERRNWQQGLGRIYYETNNDGFHIDPFRINTGKMIADGMYYYADAEYDKNMQMFLEEALASMED